MTNFEVEVSEDVIKWARESAGMTVEEAAKKLKIDVGQLNEWEVGVGNPKLSKLQQMAELYKRPLAVLLLPTPPKRFDPMRNFRLLESNKNRSYSRPLTLAFRRVEMQRSVARDLAELDNETPQALAVRAQISDDPEVVAESVRAWLGAPPVESAEYQQRDALQLWTSLIEDRDILVTQIQNVPLEEMRGCSMSGEPYPAIILNGKDARRGKVFTLLHELAHLTLDTGGVCDLEGLVPVPRSDAERVEIFCNAVAAATLMPRASVLNLPEVAARPRSATGWSEETLTNLARPFGVSAEAFLLRLVNLGRASWDYYFQFRPQFRKAYAAVEQKPKTTGGPSFYQMKLRDFGRRYTSLVIGAYRRREINGSDLADYLEIKINHLPKLEETLGGRR